MSVIYLDTHVVAWLYAGCLDRFPERPRQMIEDHPLAISPMVILELQFLNEIGRLTVGSSQVLEYLEAAIALQVCPLPFHRVIAESLDLDWTRDPFDRLIVAQARVYRRPLLTKDRNILNHFDLAIWE